MFDSNKKENDKIYNLNSFRGFYGDKNKLDKDLKLGLQSPNIINSIDKVDKDNDRSLFKMKPRLLTGRLPAAFNVLGKGIDGEGYTPKKLIVNINNNENDLIQLLTPKNRDNKKINIVLQRKNISGSDSENERNQKENKNTTTDTIDDEKRLITKPISIKHSQHRQTSASPHLKEPLIVYNNQGDKNNIANYILKDCVNTSRTHESFFPKIKNSFESKEKLVNTDMGLNTFKSAIRLEDGITLSSINKNQIKLKKFFHIPDFEIYIIKEIPMKTKNFYSEFNEKLSIWKKMIDRSKNFVKLYDEYINNPEGYISIIFEYMNGSSLQDFIEVTGCVNEYILQKITISIIESLEEYNEYFSENYGEICTCDVFFDKSCNIKVIPNIINQIKNLNNQYDYCEKCKCSEFFHAKLKLGLIKNNHYFNLGYLILIAAIGEIKFDSLDKLFNITSISEINGSVCCLYHLLVALDVKKKYSIKSFIEKRFSENFIDFLCNSLSLRKHISLNKLKNHDWIKFSVNNKVKLSIKDIIKITKENKNNILNIDNEKKRECFFNSFDIIKANKSINITDNVLIEKKRVFKELSIELGINMSELKEKIL